MHSDGPDCGRWNLIYGTCCASDGQPMGSGQEIGMQVSAFVRLGASYYSVHLYFLFECVSLSVCLLSLTACVCVCRQEKAKAPSSALKLSNLNPTPLRVSVSPSRSRSPITGLFTLFCLHACLGQPVQC